MKGHFKHKIHWWRLRSEWYRKRLNVKQPPFFINLEPTGYCNLRCTVCSYKQDRGKGYIETDLAKRVMDDAADFGVSQIRFFLAGEPIFHPRLAELIIYAKHKGLLTQVHTNANYLDAKRAEKIIESGLDAISFSFDGETREDYEAIRVGGDFEKTLVNIIRFLELKKERDLDYPHVTFQIIKPYKQGDPFKPELSVEFKEQFKGLPIDNFLVLYPFAWPGQDDKDIVRPLGMKYFPCPVLWQSLSVAWDGRVLGCCGDLNGIVILGDVQRDKLKDIWNGEQIVTMRRLHVEKRHKEISLCRECDAVFVRFHPVIRDLKDLITGSWNSL